MIQQGQSFRLHFITPTLINLRVLKVNKDLKDPKDLFLKKPQLRGRATTGHP